MEEKRKSKELAKKTKYCLLLAGGAIVCLVGGAVCYQTGKSVEKYRAHGVNDKRLLYGLISTGSGISDMILQSAENGKEVSAVFKSDHGGKIYETTVKVLSECLGD